MKTSSLFYLIFSLAFLSCSSTYKAKTKSFKKMEFEALKVYPKWEYKRAKSKTWVAPTIGLAAGIAYGYTNEIKLDGQNYTGAESASILGLGGFVLGGLVNNAINKPKSRYRRDFDVADSEEWIKSFNKQRKEAFVLHKIEPDNSIIIIPYNRLEDLKRYEQAKIDREIARVQNDEELIKRSAEIRLQRQLNEISNEEKRKNIINHMTWSPITSTGLNEIYPSAILTANAYSGYQISDRNKMRSLQDFIGLKYNPLVYGAEISYEIESTDGKFINKSVGKYLIKDNKIHYPKINWKNQDLLNNKTNTPLNIVFRIKDKAGNFREMTKTFSVLSVNECVRIYNGQDYRPISYSAFVNEQNPLIDKILQEALQKNYVDAWTGYQSGKDAVYRQIEAIWKTLSDRNIKYSSVTGASNDSNHKVFSQYIRFIDDTIESTQANCIDGTILFCSILKRIDINPHIILPPGHAYIGFDVYDKARDGTLIPLGRDYIELTMLSYYPFNSAVKEGQNNWEKGNKKYPTYKINEINIGDQRSAGINPIGN